MNQSEVLCHSAGPWKKHKYFQKIGEGANAVYRYSKKNVAGRVTGEYYDEKAKEFEDKAEDIEQERYRLQDSVIKSASNNHNIKQYKLRKANEAYIEEGKRKHGELNDQQIAAESTARNFRRKAENSIGEKITGKRAKAKMEKYAKNEMKGDESRYIDEKNKYEKSLAGRFAKAKKKLKHSDLDYQDAVMHGQMLIDQLFDNESLEHSYKGQAWKNHKYIKKKLVNGKWRYYYGPNEIDYTNDRKSAEYKAREMDYNYTGEGEDYKHFQDREIEDRKATKGTDQDMYSNHKKLNEYFEARDQKLKSEVNERYGANGMPSDVATKQRENANEQFDRYFRERKHGKGKKGHF